jgi:hypothetical protein
MGGSYGCSLETPEKIVCLNIGVHSDNTILWNCKGDLPKNSVLGETIVTCECYSLLVNDPYVIRDSCSVIFVSKTKFELKSIINLYYNFS